MVVPLKIEKNMVIAIETLNNNMFKFYTSNINTARKTKAFGNTILWHRRYGHMSLSNMQFLNDVADIDTNASN